MGARVPGIDHEREVTVVFGGEIILRNNNVVVVFVEGSSRTRTHQKVRDRLAQGDRQRGQGHAADRLECGGARHALQPGVGSTTRSSSATRLGSAENYFPRLSTTPFDISLLFIYSIITRVRHISFLVTNQTSPTNREV